MNNTVSANTLTDNLCGINIKATNSTISDNTITVNEVSGILFYSGRDNFVKNNDISLNPTGLWVYGGQNNTVYDNIIEDNGCGMTFWFAENFTVGNNDFFNNGISFPWYPKSWEHEISNNNVNNKPLVYLNGEANKNINNAGQVILVNCNNITIRNQDLNNCNDGIQMYNSNHCLISDNRISNNHEGIYMIKSSVNTIIKNSINTNENYGILLYSGYNDNNIIKWNNISNNEKGLRLDISDSNNISYNTLSSNKEYAVRLWMSNQNMLYRNIISENDEGIVLDASKNNQLYLNSLINNNISASDTLGTNNQWDNGKNGNYWSNFDEPSEEAWDNDSNGIIDTPYFIPGSTNSQDSFPLTEPIIDETKPTLEIIKPELGYVYIVNSDGIPFLTSYAFIIGKIDIKVETTDTESGVDEVEFYIDKVLKHRDDIAPYHWKWEDKTPFNFKHTIKVIAYDNAGNENIKELTVLKFF